MHSTQHSFNVNQMLLVGRLVIGPGIVAVPEIRLMALLISGTKSPRFLLVSTFKEFVSLTS